MQVRPCLTISITMLLSRAGKTRAKLSFRLWTCGMPKEQTNGDKAALLEFPKQLEGRRRQCVLF